MHTEILAYDRKIKAHFRQDPRARRIATLNGIGPITASVIVATVGNARDFKNGRQFAAWLGLTPRQLYTDGKTVLGKITKRGDIYHRTLLIHGARSELIHVHERADLKKRLGVESARREIMEQGRRGARQQACQDRLGDVGKGIEDRRARVER